MKKITINDLTEEEKIEDWLTKEQLERLSVQFINTVTVYNPKTTEYVRTKHYPLSDILHETQNTFEISVSKAKDMYKNTLQKVVDDFLLENQKGILYFSPANRFEYVNKEGKILYIFSYSTGESTELMFESNFVILKED